MRRIVLTVLPLLTGACWTPSPLQQDPTVYPWNRPKPHACTVALQPMTPEERRGKVLCNEPPEQTGPTIPVSIGTGMTWMYRPHTPTIAELTINECFRDFKKKLALGKAFNHSILLLPGDGWRMSPSTWDALPQHIRRYLIWEVALGMACQALKPVTMTVHIRDEQGRDFDRQRVSTDFDCRRRRFTLLPSRTWTRCEAGIPPVPSPDDVTAALQPAEQEIWIMCSPPRKTESHNDTESLFATRLCGTHSLIFVNQFPSSAANGGPVN